MNGQKYITRVSNPKTLTQKIRDPSDNDLLSIKLDSNNNIIQIGHSNASASFDYNEVGQVEQMKWMNRNLLNLFDDKHRLIKQVIKSSDTELSRSFAYNSYSPWPTTVRLENGAEYELEYAEDEDGRLKLIRTPSGNQHLFEVQSGRKIARTLPSGSQLYAIYNSDKVVCEYHFWRNFQFSELKIHLK